MISIIQYEKHAHIYYSEMYTYICKQKIKGRNKSKNN